MDLPTSVNFASCTGLTALAPWTCFTMLISATAEILQDLRVLNGATITTTRAEVVSFNTAKGKQALKDKFKTNPTLIESYKNDKALVFVAFDKSWIGLELILERLFSFRGVERIDLGLDRSVMVAFRTRRS